jgi:hypothetical protein
MSNPVHVIAVLDEESGHEALYVGGDLKETDFTLHMCDVARETEGMVIEFSQVIVTMPEGKDFPRKFEHVVKYIKEGN